MMYLNSKIYLAPAQSANPMRMRVQAMVQIMTAMLKADDHTCLMLYIKSRQKAVTALLQAASASGGGAVPAGAAQHRQIQECEPTPPATALLCYSHSY